MRPFIINRAATMASLQSGIGHSGMTRILSSLGLPFLHTKTYASHISTITKKLTEVYIIFNKFSILFVEISSIKITICLLEYGIHSEFCSEEDMQGI